MTEPLVVEFDVQASPEHAFETWTAGARLWWPTAHTVSGDPAAIVFDTWPGGRVYERARGDVEHDWGTVLDWAPPDRLRYRWHLFFDPSEATEVEITFRAEGERTVVRLEQLGWDRLGDAAAPRRTRTGQVWATLTQAYADRCNLPGAVSRWPQ